MRHKKVLTLLAILALLLCAAVPAFATNTADAPDADDMMMIAQNAAGTEAAAQSGAVSGKAIACGIAIGLASMGGAIAMGLASGKASEAVGRQPEAEKSAPLSCSAWSLLRRQLFTPCWWSS